jgi:hypothetical protein
MMKISNIDKVLIGTIACQVILVTWTIVTMCMSDTEKTNTTGTISYRYDASNGDVIKSGSCEEGYIQSGTETITSVDGYKQVHSICKRQDTPLVGGEILRSSQTQTFSNNSTLTADAGAPYFPPRCTVEILRQHKKDIQNARPGQMINLEPICNFFGEQEKIDLYAQMAVEDIQESHNFVHTRGPCMPDDSQPGYFICGPVRDEKGKPQ